MRNVARCCAVALAAIAVSAVKPAEAFQCPVLIQDAETSLAAAKAIGVDYKALTYVQEATRLIHEAKAGHREAKNAQDHHRAMAKAQNAEGAAERAPGR